MEKLNNEKKIIGFLCILILVSWMLNSCAKQGTLGGGPKDLQAPRLDTAISDRNFQTNFYPKEIKLYFDEWIQLKNKGQILISPPLEFKPEINQRGKHVELIFDENENLRDSTTYVINFGSAIADFTESNAVENFKFIFSTGDKIDSLLLKGSVIDSYTKKPVDKVTVMLYDNYADSVVYNEQPYYYGRTDKTGLFTISNIRPGRFKCFALLDTDYNFIYNQESEQIGFSDTLIDIRDDGSFINLDIELFLPEPEFNIMEVKITNRGKIVCLANKEIEDLSVEESNTVFQNIELLEDSLVLWYQPDTISRDSVFLVLNHQGSLDSFTVKSKSSTPKVPGMMSEEAQKKQQRLKPGEGISLLFNQIIQGLDSTKFLLTQKLDRRPVDSTQLDSVEYTPPVIDISMEIDTMDQRKININAALEEGEQYEFTIFPDAVFGFYDNTNDTMRLVYTVQTKDNFGNIYCSFDSLDITKDYVVLLKLKNLLVAERIISSVESTKLEFLSLRPGNYTLEVIVDENKNGRWDPGDYTQKRQSERKLEVKLEELRKDWDIETEIKWDNP